MSLKPINRNKNNFFLKSTFLKKEIIKDNKALLVQT